MHHSKMISLNPHDDSFNPSYVDLDDLLSFTHITATYDPARTNGYCKVEIDDGRVTRSISLWGTRNMGANEIQATLLAMRDNKQNITKLFDNYSFDDIGELFAYIPSVQFQFHLTDLDTVANFHDPEDDIVEDVADAANNFWDDGSQISVDNDEFLAGIGEKVLDHIEAMVNDDFEEYSLEQPKKDVGRVKENIATEVNEYSDLGTTFQTLEMFEDGDLEDRGFVLSGDLEGATGENYKFEVALDFADNITPSTMDSYLDAVQHDLMKHKGDNLYDITCNWLDARHANALDFTLEKVSS